MVNLRKIPNPQTIPRKQLGKIVNYILHRKFRHYFTSDSGMVFQYSLDPKLILYLYPTYDICELIWDDDYYHPMYTGSPHDDGFPLILDKSLFDTRVR
jgi:hypothetical protein